MKMEEFELLGFEANREEIWKSVVAQVQREHPQEPVRFHRFVNELIRFSANDYMNQLKMESLKGPDWFSGDEPLNMKAFDGDST